MDLRSRSRSPETPDVLNSMSPTREESIFSLDDASEAEPPKKRCRRTVAAYVRPGQRVYPQSAYFGSPAYKRAVAAKTEREVLERYLVEAWLCAVNGRLRKREKWTKTAEMVLTLLAMSSTISPSIELQTSSR
jgi:hypothetical protein